MRLTSRRVAAGTIRRRFNAVVRRDRLAKTKANSAMRFAHKRRTGRGSGAMNVAVNNMR